MKRFGDRPASTRLWLGMLAGVILLASALLGLQREARGQERNFAGSAQLNYQYVPTEEVGRDITFDGFTTEMSLKLAMDFSEHVSANVKLCFGCHGFELDMAFVDLRAADELNFRVGRFNPAFGEFPLRHDVANHRTNDKPLPYDMGRMLRLREWNMSVLPAPYVDNGIEINGTHWFGDSVQFDYAAYAVGGFRGNEQSVDIDWILSRSGAFYYVDNNSRPAVGGRMALTFDISLDVLATLGASVMHGTFDPDNEQTYTVMGADFYLRLDRVDIRAEYLVRRTEMGFRNPDQFRYGPGADGEFDNYFLKDGFYIQTNVPLGVIELVARFDGMRRFGNVVTTSPLRSESAILRYTGGFNVLLDRSARLKLTGEFYDFSDFDDEVALNAALVTVF